MTTKPGGSEQSGCWRIGLKMREKKQRFCVFPREGSSWNLGGVALDVLFLDIELGEDNGIAIARRVNEKW